MGVGGAGAGATGAGGTGAGVGGATVGAGGTISGAGGTGTGGEVGGGCTTGGVGCVCSTGGMGCARAAGGTGAGGRGSLGCGAGEACWFGDSGAGLAIDGGALPPLSNTIATDAGGVACGMTRLCKAATIASARKAIWSNTESATGQPIRRRRVGSGRRRADDAARAVRLDGVRSAGVRDAVRVAVMMDQADARQPLMRRHYAVRR